MNGKWYSNNQSNANKQFVLKYRCQWKLRRMIARNTCQFGCVLVLQCYNFWSMNQMPKTKTKYISKCFDGNCIPYFLEIKKNHFIFKSQFY